MAKWNRRSRQNRQSKHTKRQAWWARLVPLAFGLGLAFFLGGCAHHSAGNHEADASRLLKTARLDAIAGARGGFLITEIDSGSPWDRAGLKNGDEIVKADGDTLGGKHSLVKLLGAVAAPGGAELHVLRPRKERGGQVELLILKPKRAE